MSFLQSCIHEGTSEQYNSFVKDVQSEWNDYITAFLPEQVEEVKFAFYAYSNIRRIASAASSIAQDITNRLKELGWTVIDFVSVNETYYSLLTCEFPHSKLYYVQTHTCDASALTLESMKDLTPIVLTEEMTAQEAYAECAKAFHAVKSVLYAVTVQKLKADVALQDYYSRYTKLIRTIQDSTPSSAEYQKVYRWLQRRSNQKLKMYNSMMTFETLPSDKELQAYWNQWFEAHPEEMESTDDETEALVNAMGLEKLRE
jgi:hypothetical protein